MNGWDESAEAWIAAQGEEGDWSRRYVLDPAMVARIAGRGFANALDVGCGEGRFCRIMLEHGIATTGVDPTTRLIEAARISDPQGRYEIGVAEDLAFPDGGFDLVVSYLALIDIPDFRAAIMEMARVLRPGGSLLIANLTSFSTAGPVGGWVRDAEGRRSHFPIDNYLREQVQQVAWAGIAVENWHRPLSAYMQALLGAGLDLRFFDEPEPVGADPERSAVYRRVPWCFVMEWQKPGVAAP
jgi:SAM-dependent methyltransferase